MFHPNKGFKLFWDLILTLLVLAVAVELPFRLVAGLSYSESSLGFYYFVTAVFSLDIVVNLFTGEVRRGKLFNELATAQKKYLCSWFSLDALSALPLEAIFFASSPDSGFAYAIVLSRMLRIVKLPVLSRQLQRLEMGHYINPSFLRLSSCFFVIILLAHWVACGWLAIAGAQIENYLDDYIRSLYWAVTTLSTVGYGDITPQTNAQYLFAIVVMCMGVGMYAYIIGTIARVIANADQGWVEFKDRMDKVNTFVRYHQLPPQLQKRIRDYHQYLWESRHGFDERSIASDLPEPLHAEVALFILRDMLGSVPLFCDAGPEFLRTLATKLKPSVFAPGDLIVRYGEVGDRMFFISRGEVEIVSKDDSIISTLGEGNYFGEVALLFEEPRNASVRAAGYVDLYSLDKKSFEHALQFFPEFADRVGAVASKRKAND